MKKLLILLLAIVATSCKKPDIEKGTPKCVERKIIDFKKSLNCNDATVKSYTFQRNTVYAFDPGSCGADLSTEVINSDCEHLGFLGGIAGNSKINGEDFSNATFIKTVWSK